MTVFVQGSWPKTELFVRARLSHQCDPFEENSIAPRIASLLYNAVVPQGLASFHWPTKTIDLYIMAHIQARWRIALHLQPPTPQTAGRQVHHLGAEAALLLGEADRSEACAGDDGLAATATTA